MMVGQGNPVGAFLAQSLLGVALSFWGSPMCAWLVESFEPAARLTSVAIGYNVAHAIVGGSSPALATVMVNKLGPNSPGFLLTGIAVIAIIGLRCVAPREKQDAPSRPPRYAHPAFEDEIDIHHRDIS
jgi:MFS transporter, MHS family, proline/betaine transporter